MTREMGIFPHRAENDVPIPNVDGTLASIPTGREVTIAGPARFVPAPKGRGATQPSGISDTMDFIDCNTTSHEVFTGSF